MSVAIALGSAPPAQAHPRPAPSATAASPSAQTVLTEAGRHAGKPYRWGATGPSAFDCSGFVGYVFARAGKSLPRVSRDQRAAVPRIPASQALPGDLLFTHNSAGVVYHVAIYAGDGYMWDAPRTGSVVSKRKIWSSNITYGRVR